MLRCPKRLSLQGAGESPSTAAIFGDMSIGGHRVRERLGLDFAQLYDLLVASDWVK